MPPRQAAKGQWATASVFWRALAAFDTFPLVVLAAGLSRSTHRRTSSPAPDCRLLLRVVFDRQRLCRWPGGERTWCRWADRNEFPVEAILEESVLVRDMPAADELTLSWEELRVLPRSWKSVLSQWRGVYLIVDVSDGKGYVGSAYGTDNLLSRWLSYAESGHGGNKKLRGRAPEGLRFSILKRVSPDMDAADVVRLEGTWKKRLHTREFGLN